METSLKQVLNTRPKKRIINKKLKESAVLVPIFEKDGEINILFTKRSEKLAQHKGQISFPGGVRNEADTTLLDTALRESCEEIGLDPADAELLGELDDTPTTTTGFIISPYVALIPHPYTFIPNPNEITEIFSISVSDLLKKATIRQELQTTGGESLIEYYYECNGRLIWGATARILKQLLDMIEIFVELSSS
jgi:8-oxo-dGTP pyrophosphatase MutT (NUDIX family)